MKDIQFAERVAHIPRSFLRDLFGVINVPGMISFGGGFPNPEYLPTREFAHAAATAFAEDAKTLMQYGSTEGYAPLREFIATQYLHKEGMRVPIENILMTTGAQQGIDLVGRVLLNEGDSIIVENPTYLAAIQTFSAYRAHFLPITLEDDGPCITELTEILKHHKPKFFYTNPNFQNPTGRTHHNKKRKIITQMLEDAGVLIIEDDPYGEIRFDGVRQHSYRTYSDSVVLLGSFSKTVAPGLRLGWVVAHESVIASIAVAKQATDLLSSNISQHILYRYIRDNDTNAHIKRIAQNYKKHKEVMMQMIRTHLPENTQCTNPEGGMFIWITLPHIDTTELFPLAVEERVAFVPGGYFFAGKPLNTTMRLNYTNATPEEIEEGMKRLARAIARYQQLPSAE